jgi:cation transport ATPase
MPSDNEIEEEQPAAQGGGDTEEGTEASQGTKREDAKKSSNASSGSQTGGDGDDDTGGNASADENAEGEEAADAAAEPEEGKGKAAEMKKKLDKEEKERLAREKKEKAAADKAAKEAEKQRKKEEKEEAKRQKKEDAKNKPPAKLLPKATVMRRLLILSVAMLMATLGALGMMIYTYMMIEDIRSALVDAMSAYCVEKALPDRCLLIPDLLHAPYIGTLAWSVVMVIVSGLLLYGAISGRTTAELSVFIYVSSFFILVQAALATLLLVSFDELSTFGTRARIHN